MKLSALALDNIKVFISGDNKLTPHLRGPQILKLFNSVGFKDVYMSGMPNSVSRNQYIVEKLTEINGKKEMKTILEILFSAGHFAIDKEKDLKNAVKEFNAIIQNEGYRFELFHDKYKIVGIDIPDDVEVEIHFEDIQSQIIEQIRNAKYLIWVAVAWFTDKILMRELYNKQQEGLSIRLIVIDDDINANSGVELEKYFETKKVGPKGKYENIMHHKFCIIDLKTVIHGSYNWTNKARWNKETISIDNSRELAEKFATEFVELLK